MPHGTGQHASELGSWELVSREPSPALAGGASRYVGYAEAIAGPFRRRETPHGRIVLVLGLGPEIRIRDPAAPERPAERLTSFVAGLHDAPVVTEHDGEQLGVQVDLSPLAARRLLGLPLREVANRVVSFDDLLGRQGRELVERLRDAPTWDARFDHVDAFLVRRLVEAPLPTPEVALSLRRLAASHGRVGVAALAAETGWSRRHLSARFHEEVGLPPKTVARILRFERARSLLLEGDGSRLAEIAYACGYADQPHLNRDFRALAGLTPTELLARRLPGVGGISGDELPFVQDAAVLAV